MKNANFFSQEKGKREEKLHSILLCDQENKLFQGRIVLDFAPQRYCM